MDGLKKSTKLVFRRFLSAMLKCDDIGLWFNDTLSEKMHFLDYNYINTFEIYYSYNGLHRVCTNVHYIGDCLIAPLSR